MPSIKTIANSTMIGIFMPQPTVKCGTSAVESSFLESIFIMNIPKAAAANRKTVNSAIDSQGETSVDCVRMPSLAMKIAEIGMPMIEKVPKIRLQPAKACSWKTFLTCLEPYAAKLVLYDAGGEEQRRLGECVCEEVEDYPEDGDWCSDAEPDEYEAHVLD